MTKPGSPKSHRNQSSPHRVRIIGGHWRSRWIKVIDQPGLRPTTDRVRETLFNWLGQHLYGLSCLDMFAGSGVLGLEALSRGATHVTFIEKQATVFRMLKTNLDTLGECPSGSEARVLNMDALAWGTAQEAGKFDIVFIDPPFLEQKLLIEALSLANRLVKPAITSVIYVECPSETSDSFILEALPGWLIDRQMVAGSVKANLLRRNEG